MKVFLGGTCGDSVWREQVIPRINIDYFNPVVDDWNSMAQVKERIEKRKSDICLYVITPQMKGVFSIAEVIQDSNRKPHKTVMCILDDHNGESFDEATKRSLEAVADLVRDNGSCVTYSLDDVVNLLNNFKQVPSIDMDKFYPVFLDTEFTDLKQDCEIISIGITDLKNNTFYAELNDFSMNKCSEWVKENIIPSLKYNAEDAVLGNIQKSYECKGSMKEVRDMLMKWFKVISGGKQILVISDCLAYDWVLFAELVRSSNGHFPSEEIFYVPVDIMGILISRGLDIDIRREDLVDMSDEDKHNSLHDAEVIREIWKRYL